MSFRENQQRVTNPAGTLLLLELSSPSMGGLFIVNDNVDWESNGTVYTGFPFQFKLPDDVTGQTPRAQLVIDNVGRTLTEDLESLPPGEIITATIRVTDRSDPDTIERTFVLPLTSVSVTPQTVTAQVGADYIMRQRAVQKVANPYTLPGIF